LKVMLEAGRLIQRKGTRHVWVGPVLRHDIQQCMSAGQCGGGGKARRHAGRENSRA